jgi:hypothetical protein
MDILCGNMFTMYDQSLNKNFEFWIWILNFEFDLIVFAKPVACDTCYMLHVWNLKTIRE